MKSSILTALLFLLLTEVATAQNYFGLLNDSNSIVSAGVNANPNLNMNADYLFSFNTPHSFFEEYGFVAHVNFPLFSQKGFDFDVKLGVGTLLKISDKFKSLSGITWGISRTANLNGKYVHSGFKLDLPPGYYGNRWAFTPHISVNYQPVIHIKHSDNAIRAFYDIYPNGIGQFSSPKNGWFYQNNLTLQTGFGIAYYKPRWHINLTAGFQYQPNKLGLVALPDIGILPFYGSVNVGYSLSNKK